VDIFGYMLPSELVGIGVYTLFSDLLNLVYPLKVNLAFALFFHTVLPLWAAYSCDGLWMISDSVKYL